MNFIFINKLKKNILKQNYKIFINSFINKIYNKYNLKKKLN